MSRHGGRSSLSVPVFRRHGFEVFGLRSVVAFVGDDRDDPAPRCARSLCRSAQPHEHQVLATVGFDIAVELADKFGVTTSAVQASSASSVGLRPSQGVAGNCARGVSASCVGGFYALLSCRCVRGPERQDVRIGHNIDCRAFCQRWVGGLGAADRPENRGSGTAGVQVVADAPAPRKKTAKAPASAADTPSQASREAFDRVLMEVLQGGGAATTRILRWPTEGRNHIAVKTAHNSADEVRIVVHAVQGRAVVPLYRCTVVPTPRVVFVLSRVAWRNNSLAA